MDWTSGVVPDSYFRLCMEYKPRYILRITHNLSSFNSAPSTRGLRKQCLFFFSETTITINFYVFLTVHLSISLATDPLNATYTVWRYQMQYNAIWSPDKEHNSARNI